MAFVPGCHRTATPARNGSKANSPNQALLDEINAGGMWFQAKKTRAIWTRKLQQDQTVKTLEGEVAAHAGDFLCRGEAGELWPQSTKTLEARYTATDTVDGEGWRKYEPHPDAEGVLAAQVGHAFSVAATWGRLTGKAGDFILKNHRDSQVAYPEDVWVVDQALFRATYEAVKP